MLAGLMPQGSVLPLDLIGIEGARVFRKNMLRYDDPSRKKVAISGVFLFLGTRIGPMLVSRAGCPWRSAFVDDLGSVLPPLVSGFFACRICGRSCPHPIAAPAVLRYHDRNCFKRALKCILRSKQAGKGTQHNKEG